MTDLRPANAGDVARIGELAEEAGLFAADMVDDMIRPYLDDGEDLWIVAPGDASADGFLYAVAEPLTQGTFNLLAMAVSPAHRAAGIGSAMIAYAEARLAELGGRIVLVETSSQPQFESTAGFYRARGFEEEARVRDFWAEGDDKLIFRKVLA